MGRGKYGCLELQGVLRGGDVYLEVSHIWKEGQAQGLKENAHGESVGKGTWGTGPLAPQYSVRRRRGRTAKAWSRNDWGEAWG